MIRRTPRGAMRHFLTFNEVKHTSSVSSSGGPEMLVPLLSCYGAWWPMRAGEIIASGKEEMEISGKVRVDYDSRIDGEQRITADGHTLEIVGIINIDMANIELEILVKELEPDVQNDVER